MAIAAFLVAGYLGLAVGMAFMHGSGQNPCGVGMTASGSHASLCQYSGQAQAAPASQGLQVFLTILGIGLVAAVFRPQQPTPSSIFGNAPPPGLSRPLLAWLALHERRSPRLVL